MALFCLTSRRNHFYATMATNTRRFGFFQVSTLLVSFVLMPFSPPSSTSYTFFLSFEFIIDEETHIITSHIDIITNLAILTLGQAQLKIRMMYWTHMHVTSWDPTILMNRHSHTLPYALLYLLLCNVYLFCLSVVVIFFTMLYCYIMCLSCLFIVILY